MTQGILTRIKRATSELEIKELLREGALLQGASDKTRLRWKKKAAKRIKEINGS